jgi:hypothetical protein
MKNILNRIFRTTGGANVFNLEWDDEDFSWPISGFIEGIPEKQYWCENGYFACQDIKYLGKNYGLDKHTLLLNPVSINSKDFKKVSYTAEDETCYEITRNHGDFDVNLYINNVHPDKPLTRKDIIELINLLSKFV